MKWLRKHSKKISFVLGPLLYFIIQSIHFTDLSDPGKAVMACTVWIALWWITEAVDLVVTSLLPLIIFPLSGALTIGETASAYGNPFIFLFLGGFIIGLAIEKWSLHKRIAYTIIHLIGFNEKRIILGLMVATAFLSMWISNTATAIMMLPIGLSIIHHFGSKQPFSKNIMLGIAYAASIGGMATLIGTPPNIILAGVAKDSLGIDISFFNWMLFGVPLATILLFVVWFSLTRFKSQKSEQATLFELPPLGKITIPERRVLLIVGLVAFLWITRTFIWNRWLPHLDDTIIAITGALLLLTIPSGKENERLLQWESTQKLPWGILILFGAGLALAKGFSTTDLTHWLGDYFSQLSFLPTALLVILVLASINFLTEVTSNTATASILLPILITLSVTLNLDTMPLLAGAAIAASCAFMLPVATPPNAIIFSSGKVTIKEMMRAGILLNIASIFIIFLFITYFWGVVFSG